jgi:hypothetical protein
MSSAEFCSIRRHKTIAIESKSRIRNTSGQGNLPVT